MSNTPPKKIDKVVRPKRQRDIQELLQMVLKTLGYSLDATFNFQKIDDYGHPLSNQTLDSITTNILNLKALKADEIPIDLTRTEIFDNLVEYQRSKKEQLFADTRAKLKYDPAAKTNIVELIKAVCGPNYNPLFPTLFKHINWCMKRRMLGLDVEYPLLLNISGEGGCGKGYLINRWVTSLLPPGYFESVKNAGEIFNNFEKNGYLFTNRYAIIMGELSNAENIVLSILKDIIDALFVDYRVYHTQGSFNGRNVAQLFGTSNKHLREIFPRDDFIRKYFNVEFALFVDEHDKKDRWLTIEMFDFVNEMKTVDEKQPAPILSILDEYFAWVKEDCFNPTETDLWVSGFLFRNKGTEMYYHKIYQLYDDSSIKKKITKPDSFSKILKRHGAVKASRDKHGFRYTIPMSVSEPLEGSEVYFDDVKLQLRNRFNNLKGFDE